MMYEGVLTHPRNIFPQKKFAQSLAIQQEHRNFADDKPKREGRLAQLNRVSDYGSEGYRFESCGGHSSKAYHEFIKSVGRLAQLNRVSDYGSEGYRFESCGGHEKTPMPKALGSFYFNPLAA